MSKKYKIVKLIPFALLTGGIVYGISRAVCKSAGVSVTADPDRMTPENATRSILLLTSAFLATSGVMIAGTVKK